MTRARDFSDIDLTRPGYLGSAEKYRARLDGKWAMFKFGEPIEKDASKPLLASYDNAPLSEHLACSIIRTIGIPAQKTELGTYRGRIVVACEDFARNDARRIELVEFSALENSMSGGSSANRVIPELDFTLRVLDEHEWLAPLRDEARERFWDTIVIDALLGNYDRHAHNWGYLSDVETGDVVALAPIYDCASSMNPRLSSSEMEKLLANPEYLRHTVAERPKMCLNVNGKRPRYSDFLLTPEAAPARRSLLKLEPRIDFAAINALIDEPPLADGLHKAYFKALVSARKAVILDPALKLAEQEARTPGMVEPSSLTPPSPVPHASKQQPCGFTVLEGRARGGPRL